MGDGVSPRDAVIVGMGSVRVNPRDGVIGEGWVWGG